VPIRALVGRVCNGTLPLHLERVYSRMFNTQLRVYHPFNS